jgi:hypothetical protein
MIALDLAAARPARVAAQSTQRSRAASRSAGVAARAEGRSHARKAVIVRVADTSDTASRVGPPRSRLAEDASESETEPSGMRTTALRLLASLALAGGALAPVVAPPPASAASASKTASQKTALGETSTSFFERLNPNLVRLPDPVAERIDAAMLGVGRNARAFASGVKKQAEDPWSVEDVWIIFALQWVIKNGRRAAYDALANDKDDDASADASSRTKRFDASVFGWLEGPLKALNTTWILLYLHDNASRMFVVEAGAAYTGGGYLGYSFDIGMYTLCLGVVSVLATQRWLPLFLQSRFGIEEVSLQTVITRLAVIAIGAVSVLRAGLLFGVPASSILGVSGVGGLTFGLAARDVLSNVMGGTMLAILRPFKVGEEIFVTQGSNFRGSDDPTVSDYLVKEIGWYQTTLEAKDTKPTIVPNGYFLGANVINVTRATARVLILEFRVSYRDREAVPTICETIEAYLRNDEKCDSRKYPVRVNLAGAKADHLAIAVEFHVYKMPLDEHLRERGRLIFEMLAIVEARTTGPAYPTEISLETSLTKYAGK